jgi:hypothetical protein
VAHEKAQAVLSAMRRYPSGHSPAVKSPTGSPSL